MKKLASVVLASAMAVVPFAAGLAATFTPGEYEASAQGFGGTVTVKVTVDEEKVTAVTVTGEGETRRWAALRLRAITPLWWACPTLTLSMRRLARP